LLHHLDLGHLNLQLLVAHGVIVGLKEIVELLRDDIILGHAVEGHRDLAELAKLLLDVIPVFIILVPPTDQACQMLVEVDEVEE